jgi:hypothetical protein
VHDDVGDSAFTGHGRRGLLALVELGVDVGLDEAGVLVLVGDLLDALGDDLRAQPAAAVDGGRRATAGRRLYFLLPSIEMSPNLKRSPSSTGTVRKSRRFFSFAVAASGFTALTSISGSEITAFL